MILWVTGQRHAGKTTTARYITDKMGAVLLDGDAMRGSISKDLGFSMSDRLENNLRIARLARVLEAQGFDVVCATICPPEIREEVYNEAKCKWIHL